MKEFSCPNFNAPLYFSKNPYFSTKQLKQKIDSLKSLSDKIFFVTHVTYMVGSENDKFKQCEPDKARSITDIYRLFLGLGYKYSLNEFFGHFNKCKINISFCSAVSKAVTNVWFGEPDDNKFVKTLYNQLKDENLDTYKIIRTSEEPEETLYYMFEAISPLIKNLDNSTFRVKDNSSEPCEFYDKEESYLLSIRDLSDLNFDEIKIDDTDYKDEPIDIDENSDEYTDNYKNLSDRNKTLINDMKTLGYEIFSNPDME